MALRIRKADGTTIDVPADAHFVEIVNEHDGAVGLVFYQPSPGCVLTIQPGTRDAERYASMFQAQGVKFVPSIIHRKAKAT